MIQASQLQVGMRVLARLACNCRAKLVIEEVRGDSIVGRATSGKKVGTTHVVPLWRIVQILPQ